ncbi:hypothetical protein F5Y14DRAFT_451535 [Nemania sp. NC0429]|nr:hypothetical protein F5Y14DRAFT_451535 [Nemania sp. NC0429]
MWNRLFPTALPTPLRTDDGRRKDTLRRLLDEDEEDACPPPKKRARYSIYPIFDKYRQRKINDDDHSIDQLRGRRHEPPSLSPIPESPLIEQLRRSYAALRVTLHSNGVKDVAKTEEALGMEMEEKVNANLAKLSKVASKARQLYASSLDCEVDIQITAKDGEQKTRTMTVRSALSEYKDLEAQRSEKLAQLWSSWEQTQSDIDELSNKLRVFIERGMSCETSRISSNCGRADTEDLEMDHRSEQMLDDMKACEEVNPSTNPDPTWTGCFRP